MSQPLNGRVPFAVPVNVIGVTPSGTAFNETAYTLDVSRYGVRLDHVHFLRRPGDHVTLRYGERSARYRVVWVGATNTPQAGQAGLAILEGEPLLWGYDSAEPEDRPAWNPQPDAVRTSAKGDRDRRATSETFPNPSVGVAVEKTATATFLSGVAPSSQPSSARQTGTAGEERRSTPRYLCDRAVLCWKDGERVPLWGKLRDLSLGGCFVETPLPFDTGAAVTLMLMLYGYKIRAHAEVRTCRPGEGMGLHLSRMQPEDLHKLKLVLERLSEPNAERPGMMNTESSILQQLRSWFEQNDTLRREQFLSLLNISKPRK